VKKKSIFAIVIATGFGAGYWPWGPGTAGAVVATALWFVLREVALLS
jgi:phosphatidylglycerophosphatase A